MEIKVIRIYLTGSKRIHELYEEKQQALLKQEELRRAVRAQDRQMKGYGKDFELLLLEKEQLRQEIEVLKRTCDVQHAERDEWERRYRESEKARKSLGEKLEHAVGALELLKEREGNSGPSQSLRDSSPRVGESQAECGEGKRAADSCPYESNYGALRPMEGGVCL